VLLKVMTPVPLLRLTLALPIPLPYLIVLLPPTAALVGEIDAAVAQGDLVDVGTERAAAQEVVVVGAEPGERQRRGLGLTPAARD